MAATSTKDPLLYYYLGTKAYNAHSLGEAGMCFQQAIRLDPKMERAFVGLALVQQDSGDLPQAYASLKQAQLLNPRNVDTQLLLGLVVMNRSQTQASKEFEQVTKLAPKRADGWYWLGVCQDGINQRGEALTALRKAVALDPKESSYHRDLGKVLLETNFFPEAQKELERARTLNPNDSETFYLLAATRLKTAQSDTELREIDQLLTQSQALIPKGDNTTAGDRANILAQRAEVAKRLRQPKPALELVQAARKLSPGTLQFQYDEAAILRLLGREAEARTLMARYTDAVAVQNQINQLVERIKQDNKNPRLRLELARAYAKGKDFARAVNQYEFCLYLDPKEADARRELDALKLELGAKAGISKPEPPVGK